MCIRDSVGANFVKSGFTTAPSTYNYITEVRPSQDSSGNPGVKTTSYEPRPVNQAKFSFGNDFNFGQALQGASAAAVSNLPVSAAKLGVSYIVDNQDDSANKDMIRAAAQGVYIGVRAASNYENRKEAYQEQYNIAVSNKYGGTVAMNEAAINGIKTNNPQVTGAAINAISNTADIEVGQAVPVLIDVMTAENQDFPRENHSIIAPEVGEGKEPLVRDIDYGTKIFK